MGTSTSHRSLATPEWERVRELYQQPNPAPGEIVNRIVEALDEAARERLHDAATLRCLDAAVWGSAELAAGGPGLPEIATSTGVPALDLASRVRMLAQMNIAADRVASTTGPLTLDAIGPTVIEALGPTAAWSALTPEAVISQYAHYARNQQLSNLAGHFFSHDFDHVFRYFVTRDIADFIGQPALPTVHEASRLVDQVGNFCRQHGLVPALRRREQDLQEIVTLPRLQRARELEPILREGARTGLADLAGG